ncbi:hypothetical protein EVG20_g8409 [Dentipellis fragilis]|uniref:Uncharacterized protein n=1 Tax=Dentipellis fragilis TaxID=205917 RepID=A0A4Y9YAB0_9AGAM|nr:hypothetical protein EVG20_g8409 [Dentipellis fragilis]
MLTMHDARPAGDHEATELELEMTRYLLEPSARVRRSAYRMLLSLLLADSRRLAIGFRWVDRKDSDGLDRACRRIRSALSVKGTTDIEHRTSNAGTLNNMEPVRGHTFAGTHGIDRFGIDGIGCPAGHAHGPRKAEVAELRYTVLGTAVGGQRSAAVWQLVAALVFRMRRGVRRAYRSRCDVLALALFRVRLICLAWPFRARWAPGRSSSSSGSRGMWWYYLLARGCGGREAVSFSCPCHLEVGRRGWMKSGARKKMHGAGEAEITARSQADSKTKSIKLNLLAPARVFRFSTEQYTGQRAPQRLEIAAKEHRTSELICHLGHTAIQYTHTIPHTRPDPRRHPR